MKKLILFLALAASFPDLNAQVTDNAPWCPPGAKWVYRLWSMGIGGGFRRFAYDSDTTINGLTAKKILVTQIYWAGPGNIPWNTYAPAVTFVGREYYRQSGDSILWWNNGQFQLIYRFDAQPGDRWVTSNPREQCTAAGFPSADTVKVRSLRADTLGGRMYQRLDVRSDSEYYRPGQLLRNIGSLKAPYPLMNYGKCFLLSNPNGAIDYGTYDTLVCYSDNIRGDVPLATANLQGTSCSALMAYIVTAVSSLSPAGFGWSAGPNPVRGRLQVYGTGPRTQYTVRSADGRSIGTGFLRNGFVDLSGLAPGVYFLELTEKNRRAVLKVVKQ